MKALVRLVKVRNVMPVKRRERLGRRRFTLTITRIGSDRNRGPTVPSDREPESIGVDLGGSGVAFRFRRVPDCLDATPRTNHDYTVMLSP